MSDIIPPLVSSSPPPMVAGGPEDIDDDFGDFATAAELYDGYSLPTTPQHCCSNNGLQTTSSATTKNFDNNGDELLCDINNTASITSAVNNKSDSEIIEHCDSVPTHGIIDSVLVSTNNNNINNNVASDDAVATTIVAETDINVSNLNDISVSNHQVYPRIDDEVVCNNDVDNSLAETLRVDNSENETANTDAECVKDVNFVKKIDLENYDQVCDTECVNKIDLENYDQVRDVECIKDINFVKKIDLEKCDQDLDAECIKDLTDQVPETEVNNEEIRINSEEFGVDRVNSSELELESKIVNNLNYTLDNRELSDDTLDDFDDFGNFVSVENEKITKTEVNDDFRNFVSVENEKIIAKTEVNDDFRNFVSVENEKIIAKTEEVNDDDDDEDFGEFKTVKSDEPSCAVDEFDVFQDFNDDVVKCDEEETDDFGDFSDYSSHEKPTLLSCSKNEVLEISSKIITDMFPEEGKDEIDVQPMDFMVNKVFDNIKEIELTNALNYQWLNSESQKKLLSSLNIDTRNILFGPRWNPSMPRFAANLGFTPLEPVKTELQPTTNFQAPSTSHQAEQSQAEVPDAKFDWTSSGLVNPLDCSQATTMLLDLEQLVTSLDIIPHLSSKPRPESPLELDSWDYWLQSQTKDEEKSSDDININKQAKLSLVNNNNANNAVDLVLPSDTDSVNSLKLTVADVEMNENNNNNNNNKSAECEMNDDFTDFQSSKPEEMSWSGLEPMKLPLRETHISTDQQEKNEDEDLFRVVESDDFTDFQMSLPAKEIAPVSQMTLPLEPLKPIVLETSAAPTQINWPEPGIVDDNIGDFDFSFTSPVKKESEEVVNNNATKSDLVKGKSDPVKVMAPPASSNKKPIFKWEPPKQEQPQMKDDDWSDFVSAKSSAFSNILQDTCAKPQLELSVIDLQSTQLNYRALPRLPAPTSSPVKLNQQPSTQQVAAQQVQQEGYRPPYQIPLYAFASPETPQVNNPSPPDPFDMNSLPRQSIIGAYQTPASNINILSSFHSSNTTTSQNAAQQNNTPSSNFKHNSIMKPLAFNSIPSSKTPITPHPNPTTTTTTAALQNQVIDDDDWTEFVSSQPVPAANGYSKPQTKPPTLNIIANPVHFELFQSYQPGTSSSNNQNSRYKNSVPNMSNLPELDFIAPKQKFFSKK